MAEPERRPVINWDAVEALEPEVRARFDALIRDRYGAQSLLDFIPEISPHLPPPSHIKIFTDVFERARHERVRALISWPPRHAKTITALHAFAWWLRHEPADLCAYVTFSDEQARPMSQMARMFATEAGIGVNPRADNMSEWRTPAGGGLVARGISGGLTGKGISGLLIIDDPYSNREQADSPVYREKVWRWFTDVAYPRLEGASVVFIHTRWHQDDIIGRLRKDPRWEYINVPALAEEDDPLGREVGEALWPARFPVEELHDIRKQQGDWSFDALYQGRPRPRGANVFGVDKVQAFTAADFKLHKHRLIITADPAASTKTRADFSVAGVFAAKGHGSNMEMWLLDLIRGQWTVPDFARRIVRLQQEWKCSVAIEAVGAFKSVPQIIREIAPTMRIIEIHPTADKFLRAQPYAAIWNDSRFHLPIDAAYSDEYRLEHEEFTGVGDRHDDQVDVGAHACSLLARRNRRVPAGPIQVTLNG